MRSGPHISGAIKQLRGWVTAAALTVGLCAIAQMFVFGVAHYTDMRWTTPQQSAVEQPLRVVRSHPGDSDGTNAVVSSEQARSLRTEARPQRGPEKLLSSTDTTLRNVSGGMSAIGGLAALGLAVMTILGVAVAGGGAIPGVERTVTASVWAFVLAGVCLPWRDIMPSLPIPGVFGSYDHMIAWSESVTASGVGGLALIASYVLLPTLALVGSMLVLAWFRAGVAQGVIVTSVSELDEAMERELAEIRRSGVAASSPRSIGALNRAIGDDVREPAVKPGLREGRKVVDEDYKRPI